MEIKYLARNKNLRPDLVRCNWCEEVMYVDYDTDVCPCCKKEGYLTEIEEESIF